MADSFGLKITNDSGVVSMDSEFARLCVFHSGRYSGSANAVTITFQTVVPSQEPPLIFLRPDNNGAFVQSGCIINGVAGAWTGVTITGTTTIGSIFVAAFVAKPVSSYGMRLWDANGKHVFDSGTPAAIFTRALQNWTYTHTDTSAQGIATNWYSAPLNYSLGDYLMINNGRMWMMAAGNTARTTGLRFDFAAGLLRFSVTAAQNPLYFSLPAIFGKVLA